MRYFEPTRYGRIPIGPVRLKVHRIYGSVCMLQILFGLLMIICGLIAIAIRESDGSAGTPYFIFAFVSGILVISAGVCTLYIFCTNAALLDIDHLTVEMIRRRRQAIIGNQVISVLSIFACILGAVACGLFAFRECDSKTWWSICEFATKRLANKVTSVVLLVFLAISVIISVYASIISCCYGYVFVKTSGDRKRRIPIPIPVASSSPKVLVAEENHSKDFTVVDNETHRKQYYSYSSESDDEEEDDDDRTPQPEHEALLYQDQMHEQARLHHLQMQQTPNYIAVLNDPAMKQKLRERNTRLQQN